MNLDRIIANLLKMGYSRTGFVSGLSEFDIYNLCMFAMDIFLSQPMFLELTPPLKVCGDIHGQYHDLIRVFHLTGFPPSSSYLFLGDYVDRGKQSIETMCLLLAYKIKFPCKFFLLRGNHESASMNLHYGFFEECRQKYSIDVWKAFIKCFNCLPVAAIISDKIFCCHGGLSPSLFSLRQIQHIARPTEIPGQGLMCDLLWSDPDRTIRGWRPNKRGISYAFGADVVHSFASKHGISLICRGHEVVNDGYEFFANKRLVTIFSAPNYAEAFTNNGAVMSLNTNLGFHFHIL